MNLPTSLAAMNPFAILSGIYTAIDSLHTAATLVKANKKSVQRLTTRVKALKPQLDRLKQHINVTNAGAGGSQQAAKAVQLQSMLLCLTDAVALVSSFGEASWMRRFIKHGDYAEEFASINSRIAAAQADLGFGLQVDALIAAAEDADDAKADLEAICQMLPALLTAVQQAHLAAEHHHLSTAERQKYQIQLLQHQAKMMVGMQAQMKEHLERAELRSRKARQAARMAAPSPALSSSSSSRRHELLHILLSDVQLEHRAVYPGGFADVFRAQWTTRHMAVAVKKLRVDEMSAADIAEFDREAAILHALPFHAHVLQLHGVAVDEAAGTYLMIMEWMEGGSLHGLLKDSRGDPASLPLSRRLQLCVECALGVNHLHQLQPPVVHRDIKSLNFLLDKHGQVKVGDFGLARMRSATATQSTAVQAAGTLCWLPPEFLITGEGGALATAASDVYSLGVVCWEILTGEEPYAGLSYHKIRRAIEKGKLLPFPPHLPAELTQLLHACWSMDPSKRPSCLDVIKALKVCTAHSPATFSLADEAPPPYVSPIGSNSSEKQGSWETWPDLAFDLPAAAAPSSSASSVAVSAANSTTVSPIRSYTSSISAVLPSLASLESAQPDDSSDSSDDSSDSSDDSSPPSPVSQSHAAVPTQAKAQKQLPSFTPPRQALCMQNCTRLRLRLWIDGHSQRLVTELNGSIVPSSGVHILFPFKLLPSAMLLLGDQQRLLTVDSENGVRLFCFAIDEASSSISWVLLAQKKLAGATGLAFHSSSSSVLTIGKDLTHGYGFNLFALPLELTMGRFGQPIELTELSWISLDCRISVDNQRQLLAVSLPRDKLLAVYQLSGSTAHDLRLESIILGQLDAPGVNVCFDQHGAALLVTTVNRVLIFSIHAADDNGQWIFDQEPCAFVASTSITSSCIDAGVLAVTQEGRDVDYIVRLALAPKLSC